MTKKFTRRKIFEIGLLNAGALSLVACGVTSTPIAPLMTKTIAASSTPSPTETPSPTLTPTLAPTSTVTPTPAPPAGSTEIDGKYFGIENGYLVEYVFPSRQPQKINLPSDILAGLSLNKIEIFVNGYALVAKPEKDGLVGRKLFQWNKHNEQWVKYVPIRGLSYNKDHDFWNEYDPKIVLAKVIPDIKIPLFDSKGKQFPLGYVGKFQVEKNDDANVMLATGIIMDIQEKKLIRAGELYWSIAIPLPSGDIQILQISAPNVSMTQNTIFLVNSKIDLTMFESKSSGTIIDTSKLYWSDISFKKLYGMSAKYSDTYYYFINNIEEVLGAQVGICIIDKYMTMDNVDYVPQHKKLIQIIEGTDGQNSPINISNATGMLTFLIVPPALESMGGKK